MRYLATRMRTENEVRDRLSEKEYEDPEISEAIEELKLLRYIDDAEYSEAYFRYATEKGRAKRRIFAELKEKGIEDPGLENRYADFLAERGTTERDAALAVAKKEIEADPYAAKKDVSKTLAKIGRKLDSLGYTGDTIYGVSEEIKTWISTTEQED